MFINHESDHYQKEKLVVSPAVNQVVQSLSVRLLRVDLSYYSPGVWGGGAISMAESWGRGAIPVAISMAKSRDRK